MQTHQVHEAVHNIGCPGHIAHVLQQPQGGKEDEQDGQESDHRAHAANDALHDQSAGPLWPIGQQGPCPVSQSAHHVGIQRVLQRRTDGVCQPKDQGQDAGQQSHSPHRMRRPAVQTLGETDLSHLRADHCGADHAADPVVAAAGHGHQRIVVGHQDIVNLLPDRLGQQAAHHGCDLFIALQQLEGYPVGRVGSWHVGLHQSQNLVQHDLVVVPDLRATGLIGDVAAHQPLNGLGQLVYPLSPGGHHGHHRHAQSCLQHLRLHVSSLPVGHVYHVQAHDDRRGQRQQFGHQIQAALQYGRIHHGHHHIGPLLDDVVAGDDLL